MNRLYCAIFCFMASAINVFGGEGRFYLITGNFDKGAINSDEVKWAIISFSAGADGEYLFEKVVHEFDDEIDRVHLLPKSEVILAEVDFPCEWRIISTKYPEKYTTYVPTSYTDVSTAYKYDDQLLLFVEGLKEKEDRAVYLYNAISGEIKEVAYETWYDGLSPSAFRVSDSIRYAMACMDKEVFLPAPPKSIRQDNIDLLDRRSRGDRFMYFRCDETPWVRGNRFLIYDIKNKQWADDTLKVEPIDTFSFENCFAVKHKYRIETPDNSFSAYDGMWTLYINGEKQEIYLGIDSRVLFLTDEKIIFSDTNRLYECPIRDNLVMIKEIKKIAENDRIRYAESLFFEPKG